MSAKALITFLFCLFLLEDAAWGCPDANGILDVNCDGIVKVVAFGDSITHGVADELGLGYPGRLQLIFPSATIVELGVPGENTYTGRSRAVRDFARNADADFIVILEGVNDYFRGEEPSAARTKDNLVAMKKSAEATGAIVLLANLTDIKRGFQRPWVLAVNSAISQIRSVNFFSLGTSIISGDLLHPDGAGYQRMAEYLAPLLIAASNTNRPIDSDGDGVYDFAEPRYGTNPFLADSDQDGLNDGAELFLYRSNPLSPDTDGDGFSDQFEVSRGANPTGAVPIAPVIDSLELLPRD